MAEVPLPTPTDNAVPSTDIRDAVYAGAMLDKVVTSTELKYTDRLGGEHYTVDGIKAEGDKVVEETRQNLIPLSRQYMTLAAAQADIANTPEGSTTYYRSPDDSALAIEVINNSGTLEPTGRKMPSQKSVEKVKAYTDLRTGSQLSYIDSPSIKSFELIGDSGWTLGTIGAWAVGFISATQFINRVELAINWGARPDHVDLKIYQRTVDGLTDFPGGSGDTLLYSSTIAGTDLPLDPIVFGGWQRVPFRFPTIQVDTEHTVMVVIEAFNADGTHMPFSIGRKNLSSTDGLSGSQRGFFSYVSSDPSLVWNLTSTGRISVSAWYDSLSADVAIDNNVNINDITPLVSVSQNSGGWFGVEPTDPDHLYYGWQKGFPGHAGTFSCVKAILSNVNLNRRLTYAITLRAQSSSTLVAAARTQLADVLIHSGTIYPDDLLDTAEPQEVCFTFPPTVVSSDYFLIFEVVAEGVGNVAGHLGIGRHQYSGTDDDVRPGSAIDCGFFHKSGSGWNTIAAPYGIAADLGVIDIKAARVAIKEMEQENSAISERLQSLEGDMNVSQSFEAIRLSDNSGDWSTAAQTGDKIFTDWCACIPSVNGEITSIKLNLQGVRQNTELTLSCYSRLDSNQGNASGPGVLSTDVLLYSNSYQPESLASDNSNQWVSFDVTPFTVPSGSFLLVAVAGVNSGSPGTLGSGKSKTDVPATGLRGWFRRRNSRTWVNITDSGAVPYDVGYTGYTTLKAFTVALSDEVQEGGANRKERALNRYYPKATVTGRVIDMTGSVAYLEGSEKSFATESVTLDATETGTAIVNNYTLKYSAATSAWGSNVNAYLGRRHIRNVTVTRVSDGTTLTQGTDYNYDADGGKLRGLNNVADFAVNVTFDYTRERYDLIYINPVSLAVSVLKGTERDFDATEYLPSLPALSDAIYTARVLGDAVTLVPVCNFYKMGGDIFGTGDDITILNAANRRALRKTISRINNREPITLIGYGDSITAGAVGASPQETPNGETRDHRAFLGNTYPADTMADKYPAVVPNYGDGSSPGSNHLTIGWNWKLKEFIEQAGSEVKYLNYGISGSTSTGGANATRLGYVLAAGGHLMVLCFGMNDLVTPNTYTNMVSIITQAKAAGMDVIVMPVPRTPESVNSAYSGSEWLAINRYVYLAARDAGAAYVPVDWLVRPDIGGFGLADVSYCNANLRNHPGGYELRMYGEALVNCIARII
ncbi:TPA: SGNH/GDSL hydrolase family protein [Klebsiella pneumoniae subsp. pneumoniae]|nr:flagellar biosynthesis, cell-distal portion of basal-body rod [Klebsiella pneumoniae]HCC5915828.1 SGNH/GDSL hydrolase family protein [Klebsiella pneumoniae]HDU3882112.1 SGNH/GDSL hydrolase family protein [Klebsiella pneumoniae subsp. pneumoniae]